MNSNKEEVTRDKITHRYESMSSGFVLFSIHSKGNVVWMYIRQFLKTQKFYIGVCQMKRHRDGTDKFCDRMNRS